MSRLRRILSITAALALSAPAAQLAGQTGGAAAVEVGHGSEIQDNLNGGADRYRISQSPYSSYEIVVDSVTGDSTFEIARTDAAGTTVLQAGLGTSPIGLTRSLRWVNASSTTIDSQRLRITDELCPSSGSTCSADHVYRLRAYETTYAVPRFSNSGAQASIVILQNPTNATIAGAIYFWSAGGTLLNAGGYAFTLAAKASLVLSTSSLPGLAGTSGSATIAHTGRYGDLSGKVVTLEPTTGFSFDTAIVPRIR